MAALVLVLVCGILQACHCAYRNDPGLRLATGVTPEWGKIENKVVFVQILIFWSTWVLLSMFSELFSAVSIKTLTQLGVGHKSIFSCSQV